MEVEFKNLKEMKSEVENLKKDKAKVSSKSLTQIIDTQITEVEKAINVHIEQLEINELNKKEFTICIVSANLRRDLPSYGNTGVEFDVIYIVKFTKPQLKTVRGEFNFDHVKYKQGQDLYSAAHDMVREMFE